MAQDRRMWKAHTPHISHPILDGKMRILNKNGDDDDDDDDDDGDDVDALRFLDGMTYFCSQLI